MGVKRLTKFLEETADAFTAQPFPTSRGSGSGSPQPPLRVLLDTPTINLALYAYAAYLEENHQTVAGYIHPDTDILGGEAALLKEACVRVFSTMRDHLGWELFIVGDAPRFATCPFSSNENADQKAEKEKEEKKADDQTEPEEASSSVPSSAVLAYDTRNKVLEARNKEKERHIAQHFRYAEGKALSKEVVSYHNHHGPSSTHRTTPPHKFSTIIWAAVDELNKNTALINNKNKNKNKSSTIHCINLAYGEVDERIGELVAKHNIGLVLTSDSDMVAINHGARVALFSSLPWEELVVSERSLAKEVVLNTHSHADLCRALGLDPNQNSSDDTKSTNSPTKADVASPAALTEALLRGGGCSDTLLLYIACGLCGNDVTGDAFALPKSQDTQPQAKAKAATAKATTAQKPKGKKETNEKKKKGAPFATFLELSADAATCASSADLHPIEEMCRRLSHVRAGALREHGAAAKDNGDDACPYTDCLKALLADKLLLLSTAQYVSSASTPSPNASSDGSNNNKEERLPDGFARHLPNHREDLQQLYELFCRGESAPLISVVDGPEVEAAAEATRCNPYRAAGPDSLDYNELETEGRFRRVTEALVEAQRRHLGLRKEEGKKTENKKKKDKEEKKQRELTTTAATAAACYCTTTLCEVLNAPPAVRRQAFHSGVFNPQHLSCAEGIDAVMASTAELSTTTKTTTTTMAFSVHQPTLPEALLWLVHPALYEDELRVLSAMLALMALPKAEQLSIANALAASSSCVGGTETGGEEELSKAATQGSGRQLTERVAAYWRSRGMDAGAANTHRADGGHVIPSPRAIEMAFLYADAMSSVGRAATMYGFPEVDGLFASSPSPSSSPTFAALVSSFSGSLLHHLYENRARLDRIECLRAAGVLDRCDTAMGWVQRSISAFDDAAVQRTGSTSAAGFGCRGPTSAGSGQKVQKGWIGMLHRDELADLMDNGDTEIIAGGAVVGSAKLAARNKDKPLGAANLLAAEVEKAEQSAGKEPPLPILAHMRKILSTVRAHNVVCIQGETGCGKSSMIPLEIYRDAVAKGEHINIVVTQPRRLAARSLADRVASLLGETVGNTVGYRMGGGSDFHCESKNTRIRFVTTGYLLESLISHATTWSDVTHFILDEVHERSLDADMLSLVLKVRLGDRMGLSLGDLQALDGEVDSWEPIIVPDAEDGEEEYASAAASKKPETAKSSAAALRKLNGRTKKAVQRSSAPKVVVMSATIQAKLFQHYFSPLMEDRRLAPNVFVGAKRFPVKEYFIDEFIDAHGKALPSRITASLSMYAKKSANKRPASLRGEGSNALVDMALASVCPGTAVLIFLPGLDEIEGVVEQLQGISDNAPSLVCQLRVFAVHSVVDVNDQAKSITAPAENECNVIVATNIAETSLTIPCLRVVIDAGMSKRMSFDAERNLRTLLCGWCSKSAAKQRAGRTGRVGTGIVVRMYPRSTYEQHMPDFDPSEFYPLEYSVLQVRHHLAHFGSIQDVMALLIEPPPPNEITIAIRSLIKMGALDQEETVTSFGRVALRMPVDIRLTKGLLAAVALGCAAEMVVIVAGLSMQKACFTRPIRSFFNTETEFIAAVVGVSRASDRFTQKAQSDIHALLSLFPFSQLPRHRQVAALGADERPYVAFRTLGTFAKAARNIANSLLSLDISLDKEDERYLGNILAPPTNVPPSSGVFPWSFRCFKDGDRNAALQIALASSSDGLLTMVRAGGSDASGKRGQKKGAGASTTASMGRLSALPDATQDAINPEFLSVLTRVAPLSFTACPATLLPHYLSRTVVFKLPDEIAKELKGVGKDENKEEEKGDGEEKKDTVFTADNSPVIAQFEDSFTQLFGGTAQNKATMTVRGRHVVVSTALDDLRLSPSALRRGNNAATESPAARFTIIKNLRRNKNDKNNNDKNDTTAPHDGNAENARAEGADAEPEGGALLEEEEGGEEESSFASSTLPEVRFQLLPMHPNISGLLTVIALTRDRSLSVPTHPPNGNKEAETGVAEPEGTLVKLRDFMVAGRSYKSKILAASEVGGSVAPDRWAALCAPHVLPVLAEKEVRRTACVGHFSEWLGVGYGLRSMGGNLSVTHTVTMAGTPLQHLLWLATTPAMSDLPQVAVHVAFVTKDDGNSMCFVQRFGPRDLTGLFNCSHRSAHNSSLGAPLHSLVALLALTLLIHLAKSPAEFVHEKRRLISILKQMEALDGDSSVPEKARLVKDSALLHYHTYRFPDGSRGAMPDVDELLAAVDTREPTLPPAARAAMGQIELIMRRMCTLVEEEEEVEVASEESEDDYEPAPYVHHHDHGNTAPSTAAAAASKEKAKILRKIERAKDKIKSLMKNSPGPKNDKKIAAAKAKLAALEQNMAVESHRGSTNSCGVVPAAKAVKTTSESILPQPLLPPSPETAAPSFIPLGADVDTIQQYVAKYEEKLAKAVRAADTHAKNGSTATSKKWANKMAGFMSKVKAHEENLAEARRRLSEVTGTCAHVYNQHQQPNSFLQQQQQQQQQQYVCEVRQPNPFTQPLKSVGGASEKDEEKEKARLEITKCKKRLEKAENDLKKLEAKAKKVPSPKIQKEIKAAQASVAALTNNLNEAYRKSY